MRQRGRFVLLLMLVMALGVVARETPEIFDLADDVSNDGMVVGYENHLPELALRKAYPHELARPARARLPAFAEASKKHFWFGPFLDASAKAGKDILPFLSLKRE
jgi:hypothetical protein